jgi:hypothetical protein
VNAVGFDIWGFTKTPQVTVNADPTGHFTACFCWCVSPYVFPCWPCWPIWWDCWPWWWEYDILHVIEALERGRLQSNRPFASLQTGNILTRPQGDDLVRGQGFACFRKQGAEYRPDPARTALIKRKLANAEIRAIFPYWWWCCDNPNIVFDVVQGATVVLSENPATDTRWCLPDGSTVTLVANSQAISVCQPPPVTDPFAWTRVGLIPVDPAHISGGYAVGTLGTDNSDLAFYGTLDIYGGFGDPTVAYYQVNTAQWSGDPSRSGTPPTTSALLSALVQLRVHLRQQLHAEILWPYPDGPVQPGRTNESLRDHAGSGRPGHCWAACLPGPRAQRLHHLGLRTAADLRRCLCTDRRRQRWGCGLDP